MRVLVVNESTSTSIISDIFSFVCLLVAWLVNYHFFGNSVVLQIVIVFLFIAGLLTMADGKSKHMTPDEALEYLQKYAKGEAEDGTQ